MDQEHQPASDAAKISADLARRVQEELDQNVYLCYQCVRCSSGCPLTEFFDYVPNQVMRLVQTEAEEFETL